MTDPVEIPMVAYPPQIQQPAASYCNASNFFPDADGNEKSDYLNESGGGSLKKVKPSNCSDLHLTSSKLMPPAEVSNISPLMASLQAQNHVTWVPKLLPIPNCPPGLEYLTQVKELLVHQQIELLEVFTNWETKNKYSIKNSFGNQIYFATEESDVCSRQCCGPQRSFIMHINDNMGCEVLKVNRQFKCCALPVPCCYCCAKMRCCAQELVIEAPPGQVIGRVSQKSSCFEPQYIVEDADGETALVIRGPCCICQGPCCTWDQEFVAFNSDVTEELGKISKQWSGFVREYFTDADNFAVTFPIDLDVRMKACMLSAVFLIDFMFFEDNQQNQNN